MRLLFSFLLLSSTLFSCCDFLLSHKGEYVVGRTMEFEKKVTSQLIIFPKGTRFVSRLSDQGVGVSWIGKYGFMGMDAFGTDSLVDGFNDKGLSFGALWFPETKYPKIDPSSRKEKIALQDIGNWILSTCASVEDVKSALQNVEIEAVSLASIGSIPPLHFAIHDVYGNSLVVEFLNGKMHLIDNPIHVLTNSPSFEWQMTNLRNYVNLTPENAESIKLNDMVLQPTGQGTGMMGLPGDWTPPSRFVRIAFFTQFLLLGQERNALVNGALHLINTVDIPYGLVRERKKESYDYTQWACVKNLSQQIFHYRTYQDLNLQTIRLQDELRSIGRTIRRIPVHGTSP